MTDVLERYCDTCGVIERVATNDVINIPRHEWLRKWYIVSSTRDGKVFRNHYCKECTKVAKAAFEELEPTRVQPAPIIQQQRSVPKKKQVAPKPKPKEDWFA